MGEQLFDSIARALATPMPRRSALRLAAAAVAATIAGARPGLARAQDPCEGQPDGTACDDGNVCTTDICIGGICVVGAVVTCDDNYPCTVDTCDPVQGCVHTEIPGGTPCGSVCCPAGSSCIGDACCPDDEGCGPTCCPPSTPLGTFTCCGRTTCCGPLELGFRCIDRECCPPERACGAVCCPPGEECKNGKCKKAKDKTK